MICHSVVLLFFFNDTATTEIYTYVHTRALHDALPISVRFKRKLLIGIAAVACGGVFGVTWLALQGPGMRIGQQGQELYNTERKPTPEGDRKSTRLNSSH